MTSILEPARIATKCDQCGQWDDHPKVHVGFIPWVREGQSSTRHHDCLDYATKADILGGSHSQHPLIAAKIIDAAEKGTHGKDLAELIASQQMSDYGDATMMATSGMDQAMANAAITALLPGTGTATVGSVTVTAPIKCRFDSTITTSGTSASTEWTTSGGYTAGGVSTGSAWAAASGGARATNAAVSVTNAPSQIWQGNELWDSSGTPLRVLYGAITGGQKTVNSGDTCTIPSGSLSGSLSI